MIENLLSIESLLAVSVGAIFSIRVNKVSLSLKSNVRNQSPDIHGSNNVVIYNQAMVDVGKEMAFSVKVCSVGMMIFFHVFPSFFINLLLSLSFFLPVFSFIGVVNAIRLNGISRGWDILYLLASLVMGVIFYCTAGIMLNNLSVYPQLAQLYDYLSQYRLIEVFSATPQIDNFLFVVMSSMACPALIVIGFYVAFAHTVARDGNNVFRYSTILLSLGYISYILLSGVFILLYQGRNYNFDLVLTYPFKTLMSLFSF